MRGLLLLLLSLWDVGAHCCPFICCRNVYAAPQAAVLFGTTGDLTASLMGRLVLDWWAVAVVRASSRRVEPKAA